ncbi:hypothetical protein VTL71DRAFT_5065 [Oculimacula yallundae]|uniref:Heterokaryon incompatibility domain-containing protein n=1 Tax=Oculimacula yallundae TaxID=86028 RepID=A0ABR4C080_9HELO
MMRCEACQKIVFANIRFGQEILQQPSFAALKSSADAGCDLCNLSLSALISVWPAEWSGMSGFYVALHEEKESGHHSGEYDTGIRLQGLVYDNYEWDQSPDKIERVVVTVGDETKYRSFNAPLGVYAEPGTLPAKYIAGRIPPRNSGSVECLSKIDLLIKSCDQYHTKCSSLAKIWPLPTRILDIENEPIVRTTNGMCERYVALSYCWGRSGKNILLTKKKDPSGGESIFDKFTSGGLRENMLARTIQDAITVCRSMGIKYLWVDALCIIQEERDLADFKAEAPMMTEYYSNAYFTLIAGSAHDCADGFLAERAAPIPPPCELHYSREHLPSGAPQLEGVGKIYIGLPFDQSTGPTLSRAWTFQESELSRRYVTFGPSQFQVHCPSVAKFEDGDFKAVTSLDRPWTAIGRKAPSLHAVIKHMDELEAVEYALQFWYRSIFVYTGRRLGRVEDKLAAIAGAARLVQSVVKCKYLYGLWENDMVRGLLWRTINVRSTRRGVTSRNIDRAPSWSWASIDGQVTTWPIPPTVKILQDPGNWLLQCLSNNHFSGALDAIRDNVVIPKGFELSVRGFVTKVWHIPATYKSHDMVLVDIEPSTAFSPVPVKWEGGEELVAAGAWDTLDDYESRKYWGRQIHALLLIPGQGLLLDELSSNSYRRIGRFALAKERLFREAELEDIILI